MKGIYIKRLFCSILTLSVLFLMMGCSSDSNPASPSSGMPFATKVNGYKFRCEELNNQYTNPEEALGPPDYRGWRDPDSPIGASYSGFVSLGPGGNIVLEMGVDVIDGPGSDIKVYQAVSYETTGVYVTDELSHPFFFLGSKRCDGSCYFDISGSGYSKIRYVKVEDRSFPNCYVTAGADIDAVEAINYR